MTTTLPFEIDTAEKIETIVLNHLRTQTLEGRCGEILAIDNDWYTLRADGQIFHVTRGPAHWRVVRVATGVEGRDADLLTAAEMAFAA